MNFFDRLMWDRGVFFLLPVGTPFLLLGLAIPYAVLRLRESEDSTPQIGLSAALHYFFSLSLLLFLIGLTLFVIEIFPLTRRPGFGAPVFPTPAQRTAMALMTSGGLFGLLHFMCIMLMTPTPFSSPVRRMFLGCRLAVHGVVVMIALTTLMVVLLQENIGDADTLRDSLSVLFVWGPSWFVHLLLLRLASKRKKTPWGPEPFSSLPRLG